MLSRVCRYLTFPTLLLRSPVKPILRLKEIQAGPVTNSTGTFVVAQRRLDSASPITSSYEAVLPGATAYLLTWAFSTVALSLEMFGWNTALILAFSVTVRGEYAVGAGASLARITLRNHLYKVLSVASCSALVRC